MATIPRPFNPFVQGNEALISPRPMAKQRPKMRPPPSAPPRRAMQSAPMGGPPQTMGPIPGMGQVIPPSMMMPQGAGASAQPAGGGKAPLGQRLKDFAGSDAALAMAAGVLGGGTTGEALGRGFQYALQARQKPEAATTDDIREYAFAKQQGYDGSFTDFMTEMKKAGKPETNISVGGDQYTPGWKKVDEKYAEEYVDWRATGGFADIDKQIGQLDEALKIVEETPGITGPMIGNLPDWAAAAFNPDGTIAKEYVEEVVQRNLRVILGAQFTEREGERLISRAYNPRLPPAENARRVRRLIQQIKTMAATKEEAANYFEQNGTLQGFQGRVPSATDLYQLDFGDTGAAPGGGQGGSGQPPPDVSPEEWGAMTPEERALWQN